MKQSDIETHLSESKEYLAEELSKIRTGRASASLVEDIMVQAYEGSDPMSIKELASVNVPDAQSVLVTPWDKSIVLAVEKAIVDSGKGLSPVNDGENIRVPIPQLTEERRVDYTKEVSKYVEQAKVKIRTVRQNAIRAVEEQEENGVITEDEMHRQKKLLEEQILKTNKELEEMGEKKKAEIMQV